ncbi:MAG: YIP1 family protein [Candidatus Margulisiibacteriota bacterium]
MKKAINDYFNTWWTIILRPIYFYTKLKEENWKEKSLTFLLITSWLLALGATLVIFIVQYVPIGSTLVEGVKGAKFIIVLPVLLTLAFVFFMITLLILGGLLTLSFFTIFYLMGYLLHYIYMLLGGKGSLNRMIQSSLYSSAVIAGGMLVFLLMILTKFAGLDFLLFRYGFNTIYFLMTLYVYGLWAVAGRKTYGVPKWKAFVGAIVPAAAMLIFGILFDKIALSRLQPWIS